MSEPLFSTFRIAVQRAEAWPWRWEAKAEYADTWSRGMTRRAAIRRASGRWRRECRIARSLEYVDADAVD